MFGKHLVFNLTHSNPGRREKFKLIFFHTFCGATKGLVNAFKAFVKPFEAPQIRVKIEI